MPDEDTDHIILVAFSVSAPSRTAAHTALVYRLPRPQATPTSPILAWWVAEDDRHDGSDLDSAVFVEPGNQQLAYQHLVRLGLTGEHNLAD